MASKSNIANKSSAKPTRANLVVYPSSLINTDVYTHSHGTRRRTKALVEALAQTSSVLDNLAFNTFSPNSEEILASQTTLSRGSSASHKLEE